LTLSAATPTPTHAAVQAPLTIDIVSDVVCPWCYIGKRKLEAALALPQAAGLPPVQIRWHPFQLNPDLPEAGMPRKQYLEEKFGGPARATEIYARVHAAGVAVGLDLNFDAIKQQANTLAAHALIAFAQQGAGNGPDNEVGNRVKEHLLKAYFVEGRFIGSVDVLTQIAAEAGLDADAARAYLGNAANRAEIAQADAQARQMGVTGVPFFIFNQKVAVSGAQDPQTLLAAMQQAVDEGASAAV
jgi:predicted DsbA family dithiol-disulfide isomerase